MNGRYVLEIQTPKMKYSLSLEKKITVILGCSGSGKSNFVKLCKQIMGSRRSLVKSNYRGRVIVLNSYDDCWENKISAVKDCFIVADGGCDFIKCSRFAEVVSHSDNYFILVTRSFLYYIPESMTSIGEFKSKIEDGYVYTELKSRA